RYILRMGSCRGHFFLEAYQGKQDVEAGATGELALDFNLPAVLLYDPMNDRKPQPRTVILGRKEWIEDMCDVFWFDSNAVVLNSEPQDLVYVPRLARQRGRPSIGRSDFGCYSERTARLHSVESVDKEI